MKANPNLQSATGRRRAILEYLTAKSQTNTSTLTYIMKVVWKSMRLSQILRISTKALSSHSKTSGTILYSAQWMEYLVGLYSAHLTELIAHQRESLAGYVYLRASILTRTPARRQSVQRLA